VTPSTDSAQPSGQTTLVVACPGAISPGSRVGSDNSLMRSLVTASGHRLTMFRAS
jgi:hypothetical protein